MVKPKKKRKGDAVQVAYGIMQDVIRQSEKPIKAPSAAKRKK